MHPTHICIQMKMRSIFIRCDNTCGMLRLNAPSSITTANMMIIMIYVDMVMSIMPCVHGYASIIMMINTQRFGEMAFYLCILFLLWTIWKCINTHTHTHCLLCHDSSSVFTLMMHTRRMPFESITLTLKHIENTDVFRWHEKVHIVSVMAQVQHFYIDMFEFECKMMNSIFI